MRLKKVISDSSSLAVRDRWTPRVFLCGLLALSLIAGDALAGQMPAANDAERDRANWEKVRAITPDKQVVVETLSPGGSSDDIRTYRGQLRKWEPASFVLGTQKDGDKVIGKSLIRNVWVREKGNRGKAAAIGGAVGFGIGAAIGANIEIPDRNPTAGDRAAGVALVGGIWAVIGALIGRAAGGTRLMTVYHAR
jgi:hypothetical protein